MTHLDSFTVQRDTRTYTVDVYHDDAADNPRDDYDHSATEMFVPGKRSSNPRVDELTGGAGDALKRFIDLYYWPGHRDIATVKRAFHIWAVIAGSAKVLVTGSDHGYAQGDYHEWFMLVDTDVMRREGYGGTPESVAKAEASDYAAWVYGDVFYIAVSLNDVRVEGGLLGGIIDRDGTQGPIVREVADEIIDSHEASLQEEASYAGAGFIGVI